MRQELIQKIAKLQLELKEHDAWFDSLEVGQMIYEDGIHDCFDVEVIVWDREKGEVFCKYIAGGETHEKWIAKHNLSKTIIDKRWSF